MDAKKAIEKARALEKAGQGESAVKLFREAGATEDAARVLGGPLRRPRDAGQLLLESLGVQPAQAPDRASARHGRIPGASDWWG